MKKKAREYSSAMIDYIFEEINQADLERTKKMMSLAVKIDDAIKSKGWTNVQFAEKMGKNTDEINDWLSGDHNFTVQTLLDLENILEIKLLLLDNQVSKIAFEV